MVRITVHTIGGLPRRIVADGHASRSGENESVPCAAVSLVLKSFGLAVASNRTCTVRVGADEPGTFDIELRNCQTAHWLEGVWTMARISLMEIEERWPEEVRTNIVEERRDGT